MSNENIANRFSQLYKHETKMYDDSSRFRVRVYTYLDKIAEKVYQEMDETTLSVVRQKIEEFKKWTDSAQSYRHGQATENIDEPPLSLAILIISTGVSFLRWLAWLDQAIREMNTADK